MGYALNTEAMNAVLAELAKTHVLFAPHRYIGQGEFSDTDSIRYKQISTVEEIELQEKSKHSFKEAFMPISETLFYFTEDTVKQADAPHKKAIVFLRSCDLHAVKRLDAIYMQNAAEDFYYKRLRENIKFILLGCVDSYANCFCVDMGTNISDDYDASLDLRNGMYYMDCKLQEWESLLGGHAEKKTDVTPAHVTSNPTRVKVPEDLSADALKSKMWDEYDTRCIACGRCNFSCPTCTCFTMQDVFYTDNAKTGERRRVWASCMVDGYTGVAGGGSYRKKFGQRMRFKVLHKVLDFKQRFGYQMCVGCGRCDDVCPEYISFSSAVNKLGAAMKEVDKA